MDCLATPLPPTVTTTVVAKRLVFLSVALIEVSPPRMPMLEIQLHRKLLKELLGNMSHSSAQVFSFLGFATNPDYEGSILLLFSNGDATPPVNGSIEHRGALRKDEEEEEEEDGYRQRSKKQRIILDSDAESIPDSSHCTPPPTKSEGSTGYSPDSIVSAASVANRSRITRSSDGKFRRQLPMGNPNICENNLAIVHQPIEHPAVKEAFDSVRETLQPILLQKVTRIRKDELTVEFGLETAASIDLLNLVNASIHGLEEIGERARLGVTLLEEGQKKVNEGKHILFSAISEIPNRIK
ncbi:Proteasome activator subunit 4 [Camellia lanceoleosa]|uniref:Proteasome activator subunit 4 n=1 Tax=Camellia lanceoleosa TaxID=1840588 RepID=A0ACC0G933_9ERIC|nr:Proteasome activator subunit 4 [Camellia lanceoleosa]